jgi:hypothetical protein
MLCLNDAYIEVEVAAVRAQSKPRTEPKMDLYESNTHPFIVKIWLEEMAQEAGQATWRGHITHVPSGTRRYIQALDDILIFIAPYLRQMGVQLEDSS